MARRGFSVGAKLRAGFASALVILVAIGAVAFYNTRKLVAVTEARAEARQFLWDLDRVVSSIRGAQNEQRAYLLTGANENLTAFHDLSDSFAAALLDLKRRDPSMRQRIDELLTLIDSEVQGLLNIVTTRNIKGLDAAIAEMKAEGSTSRMKAIRAKVAEIEAIEKQVLAVRAAEEEATVRRTFWAIGAGTVLALIVVMSASLLITRGITEPVRELVRGAERIGNGELSARIAIASNDEIGELAASFNRMAESLAAQNRVLSDSGTALTGGVRVISDGSSMLVGRSQEQSQLVENSTRSLDNVRSGIDQVFKTAEQVNRRTEECAARAAELQASSEQVRGSMQNLFESVENTSASSAQMSTASTQMTSMISSLTAVGEQMLSFVSEMEATTRQLDETARQTATLSNQAREEALTGSGAVQRTVSGIDRSRELIEKAATALDDLAARAGEIERIVAVIAEVTQQTNLLALNAAIIAAQAGEQGRPFTVVADEMRELADQTRRSTEEITAMIDGLQKGSRDAVRAMHEGRDLVRGNVDVAQNASASLGRIVTASTTSFEMAEKISNSLKQQADASARLHEATSRMADHIEENRRSIEEQARNAQLLAAEADRVRDIARQVRTASEEQSVAASDIATSVEQIDNDARHTRDLLGEQIAELERIAGAAKAMREIAQQNNSLAGEFTATLRQLARSSEDFQVVVDQLRAAQA